MGNLDKQVRGHLHDVLEECFSNGLKYKEKYNEYVRSTFVGDNIAPDILFIGEFVLSPSVIENVEQTDAFYAVISDLAYWAYCGKECHEYYNVHRYLYIDETETYYITAKLFERFNIPYRLEVRSIQFENTEKNQ